MNLKNELARVKLEFITPLLLREIDILSRPLSYIEYTVEIKDKNVHDVRFFTLIFRRSAVLPTGHRRLSLKAVNLAFSVAILNRKFSGEQEIISV